jgi:predicted membrane-bound dolichyl-phosphate-mannose-protein mannosyltransferase
VTLAMAADPANADAYNAILDREIGVVDGIPLLMGMIGTILAILFLGIGLLRAKVGPAWIPIALFVFLVLEFAVGNFVPWAFYASGALYLIALVALAVVVWKSPIEQWMTVADGRAAEVESMPAAR